MFTHEFHKTKPINGTCLISILLRFLASWWINLILRECLLSGSWRGIPQLCKFFYLGRQSINKTLLILGIFDTDLFWLNVVCLDTLCNFSTMNCKHDGSVCIRRVTRGYVHCQIPLAMHELGPWFIWKAFQWLHA